MKVELSSEQVKALVQILVNYFNGQRSIAAEAPEIQELLKAIQTPIKETQTQAPSEVKETETDGAEK